MCKHILYSCKCMHIANSIVYIFVAVLLQLTLIVLVYFVTHLQHTNWILGNVLCTQFMFWSIIVIQTCKKIVLSHESLDRIEPNGTKNIILDSNEKRKKIDVRSRDISMHVIVPFICVYR